MLNEKDIEILKKLVRIELSDDFDKFDIEANIDKTLTFEENKRQIFEKIRNFKENLKEEVVEIKKKKYDLLENDFINKNYEPNLFDLFLTSKVIGFVGDTNTCKSNGLYYLGITLKEKYNCNIYSFGLKFDFGDKKFYSITELEQIKDSIVFIDEFYNLFNLEDRTQRKSIEKTFRLLYHNNNILVLAGVPDNFKKFISSQINVFFFFKSTISGFINGSKAKEICLDYHGVELGSRVLEISKDKALMFDGSYYRLITIPYLKKYDSKLNNKKIVVEKVIENVENLLNKKEEKNENN